jgi:hypothetical protein
LGVSEISTSFHDDGVFRFRQELVFGETSVVEYARRVVEDYRERGEGGAGVFDRWAMSGAPSLEFFNSTSLISDAVEIGAFLSERKRSPKHHADGFAAGIS